MLHRLRVGGIQLLCPGWVHNRHKEGPRLPVYLASIQAGSVQQIYWNRLLWTTLLLYKYIIIMSTLEITRKIRYNDQLTMFHIAHNCPVTNIQWYLRSMRWLLCGNKDNPFFPVPWLLVILSVLALWGRKGPWDETSQYSKTQQFISRASWLGLNADFPLALLILVGGYLWMTSFILLFDHRGYVWAFGGQDALDRIVYFPEWRQPFCLWA